ncbi:hypothetical protein AcV7_004073 [Taiwanofungus camphoratus]|nr:hypothetical protein AcV7_004073 [Antrodia cinnamomea]
MRGVGYGHMPISRQAEHQPFKFQISSFKFRVSSLDLTRFTFSVPRERAYAATAVNSQDDSARGATQRRSDARAPDADSRASLLSRAAVALPVPVPYKYRTP